MFDQHVHSNFSFDSNEDLENYINVSNKNDIVTTSIQSKNIQQNIQLLMTDYGQVFRGKLEESFAKTEELIVEFASRIEAADW